MNSRKWLNLSPIGRSTVLAAVVAPVFAGLIGLVAACGGVSVSTGDADADATGTATAGAGAAGKPTARPTIDRSVERVVTADGVLRYPADPRALAFGASGVVVALDVAEQAEVGQGAPLARLDTLGLELAVAEARSQVLAARARVAQLETGSSVEQARLELERAKNSLWSTQVQRDAQCGRAEDGDLPGAVRDEAKTGCDGAQANVQASEQGVRLAELALRQAEATADEDLAAAGAQLGSAELGLRQAQVNLNKATLVAPFTGTVSAIQIEVGQPAGPGAPAMTLTRTRPLRFVTTNLGERFVGDIREGDAAEVTLTAYPDRPLKAIVHRIEDQGKTDESGAVVFAVYLHVAEEPDVPLRAGMTGRAEISVGGG